MYSELSPKEIWIVVLLYKLHIVTQCYMKRDHFYGHMQLKFKMYIKARFYLKKSVNSSVMLFYARLEILLGENFIYLIKILTSPSLRILMSGMRIPSPVLKPTKT